MNSYIVTFEHSTAATSLLKCQCNTENFFFPKNKQNMGYKGMFSIEKWGGKLNIMQTQERGEYSGSLKSCNPKRPADRIHKWCCHLKGRSRMCAVSDVMIQIRVQKNRLFIGYSATSTTHSALMNSTVSSLFNLEKALKNGRAHWNIELLPPNLQLVKLFTFERNRSHVMRSFWKIHPRAIHRSNQCLFILSHRYPSFKIQLRYQPLG